MVLVQVDPPIPILQFAAHRALWQLPKDKLQRVATERGVEPEGNTIYDLVRALVVDLLPPMEEAVLQELLAARGGLAP